MKEYKVFITQHYEPVVIKANSVEEAEHEVRNNYVWGEPIDADILAIGVFETNPVDNQTRKRSQKL